MIKELLMGTTPVSSPYLKTETANPARLRATFSSTSTSEETTYFRTMERSTAKPSSLLLMDLRRGGSLLNPASHL